MGALASEEGEHARRGSRSQAMQEGSQRLLQQPEVALRGEVKPPQSLTMVLTSVRACSFEFCV